VHFKYIFITARPLLLFLQNALRCILS